MEVSFNYEDYEDFDQHIDRAIKEANHICGYKKTFTEQVPEDMAAEGLDVVRKAYNIRAHIYKLRDVRSTKMKELGAVLTVDMDKALELQKELIEIADKIVVHGFQLVRLRVPLDNFLFENGIDERPRKRMKME